MNLATRFLCALAFLAATAGPAGAAIIYRSQLPVSMNIGETTTFLVGIEPEAGEEISGFQFDVIFSPWLTPGTVIEKGYFASHGVFFFEGIAGPDSISFILDTLAAGDYLPSTDLLISIQFTATQAGVPMIDIANAVMVLTSGSDAVISDTLFYPPVSSVPEPAGLALSGAGLCLLWLRRRKRVRR